MRVHHTSVKLMVFHRNSSDSKPFQISRILLSILVDINNVVVWMVSTYPLISKSTIPFTNPLGIVPSTPITNGIKFTFIFYKFFSSQVWSWYLSFFFFILSVLTCGQPGRQVHYSAGSLCRLSLGKVVWQIRRSVCISKYQTGFASHFPGRNLGCAYTIWSYGQI